MYQITAATTIILVTLLFFFADFERYSIFSVGSFRRITRSSVRTSGHKCVDCDEEIEIGECRKWYKELVIFGVPTIKYDGGTHRYCFDHADISIRDDLKPADEFETPVITSESEFDDVVTKTSTAFQLIPVMMVVLFVAVIIRLISGKVDNGN